MTAIQAQQAAFLDLSGWTKLCITGSDRLRFLNGQITNAVHKATETAAIEACVLNAKGRVNAHIFVSAAPDCFFVDAEPELRETLSARLERYIIADDVQVEDISDRWSIFHILSRAAPDLSNCRAVFARRFLEPGWDLWTESAMHDAVAQQLSSRFNLLDSSAAEIMRIEEGIPRWGRELSEEIIPIEANLEERTIDYDKGCYIGQEVISRMKVSGQTNKRLCGLISLHDFPFRADMKLAAISSKGKEAGWITSAVRSDRIGKEIALGYVKRGFNNPGTRLEAITPENAGESDATPVEVVSLPFLKQESV
jgi:folate-binding protein YgfZ